MAVYLEFFNVLVPIENIERVYPGGFKQFLIDNEEHIGYTIWYDDYLLRDGSMDIEGAIDIIKFWESYGLIAIEENDGTEYWKDLCLFQAYLGSKRACDWIEYENYREIASMKGKISKTNGYPFKRWESEE